MHHSVDLLHAGTTWAHSLV